MVNTIFILDKTYNTTQILVGDKGSQRMFWDDLYTQEFDTGAETFEFSCYLDENVVEGNYVAFYYNNQYKLFTIMDMEQTHKKGRLVANCYCEIASLSLLNNYVREFSGDMNCIQFFEHILNGTDWHIGRYSTSLKNRVETIKVTKIESVWSLIEDYKDIFECEINVRVTYENGHVTGKYIDIYSDGGLGSSTLKRFEYGRNVTGITKKKELYDWCTAIILDVDCDVADTIINESAGLGFTKGAGDVIVNEQANKMYNAGKNYVVGVYEGDETEPVEACINAWKELEKRSTPRFDYEVTTALSEDEYEEVHLGDTVYVVDHSYTPALFLEARVGKLELSFTDRTQNKCTLTNYKEIKSKLLDVDYIKLTGTITDIVNAFFPITSEGIADGAITEGKIETTYFQQITADIISAGIGAFEDLYVQNMTVINADINKLKADKIEVGDLTAINGEIENLKAGKADIGTVNATNINVANLQATVGNIQTLLNGNLTSDNIQSLNITADKVTVADGFIKNAMIDTINANKVTAGTIDTSKVNISSTDGSMVLSGSLQQFKDKNGKVRIQIGKDAQGNFTFTLFDENGTGVLIDEKGITENAIADGLIVNDMVAENANIVGSKLDIDSVVTEINNGTTTIKGTKVVLDEDNQTLDMAFSSLETKIDDIEIGGRNLFRFGETYLLNGKAPSTYWSYSRGNLSVVEHEDLGGSFYNLTATNPTTHSQPTSWANPKLNLYCMDVVSGEDYTISFEYVRSENCKGLRAEIFDDSDKYKATIVDDTTSIPANTLQKVTVTWKSTYTGKVTVTFFNKGKIQDNDISSSISFRKIKFEKGNKATDWTPAIEDVDDKITSNTTAINVQQGQIKTLISNTTITTENAEGGTVETTLKDAYSQFTQDLGGFKTEVNELMSARETAVKTEIDGMLKENYVPKEEYSLFQESYTSNMEQTAQSIDMIFTQTQANITEVDDKITQFEESMSQYIRFGAEGIELGDTTSSFKAKLDNEKLAFVEGDTEVAHISNKTMHITDARVNTSLQIGQFRFLPRTNGNLSFTWVNDVNVVLEEGEE